MATEPPTPPAHESVLACPSTSRDGPVELFKICFGFNGEPPFVAGDDERRELRLTATVISAPSADYPFSSCVLDPTTAQTQTVFFVADDVEYKLLLVATRGEAEALPQWRPAVGSRFDFTFVSDLVGNNAVVVDSQERRLVASRFPTQVTDLPGGVEVSRGEPDGSPVEVACGTIQPDTFLLRVADKTQVVSRGDCVSLGQVVFLGVQAFHPVARGCSDGGSPLSWAATW
jgi:hypothetical protein